MLSQRTRRDFSWQFLSLCRTRKQSLLINMTGWMRPGIKYDRNLQKPLQKLQSDGALWANYFGHHDLWNTKKCWISNLKLSKDLSSNMFWMGLCSFDSRFMSRDHNLNDWSSNKGLAGVEKRSRIWKGKLLSHWKSVTASEVWLPHTKRL